MAKNAKIRRVTLETYEKQAVLEALDSYITGAILYIGNVMEGLSYTLHLTDESDKEYAITLFVALTFLEQEKFKHLYELSEQDKEDLMFWKSKQDILLKEHVLDAEKLKEVTLKALHQYEEEILEALQ